MDEPQSELARYAFGFSDKKPSWLFWAIQAVMLAFVLWAIFSPAFACHKFSVWKYPWPQSCRVTALAPPMIRSRARLELVLPAPREILLPSLTDIDWGHGPDDELRARLMLRVILQGKDDK